jgi:hypothetical protein
MMNSAIGIEFSSSLFAVETSANGQNAIIISL